MNVFKKNVRDRKNYWAAVDEDCDPAFEKFGCGDVGFFVAADAAKEPRAGALKKLQDVVTVYNAVYVDLANAFGDFFNYVRVGDVGDIGDGYFGFCPSSRGEVYLGELWVGDTFFYKLQVGVDIFDEAFARAANDALSWGFGDCAFGDF